MKNKLLLGFILPLLFASCIEQKYIYKGTLSTIKTNLKGGVVTDSIYVYKIKTAFKSKIESKGEYIVVKTVDKNDLTLTHSILLAGAPTGTKKDFINKYYYPEDELDVTIEKLVYFDTKPILQGLSIPIKIRPKINERPFLDSFPSQTETGFNPALAFGWKFNINSQSSKKDIFGKNLKQFSFTPGWFLGTGAADLKKSNTRNPIIVFERKAAIISTGGFLMGGYNNINIGYSFGWDYATGVGRNGWLYQGKLWHGITIGLDIIK